MHFIHDAFLLQSYVNEQRGKKEVSVLQQRYFDSLELNHQPSRRKV